MKTKKQKLKIAIFHLAFFYSGGGERLVMEEIDGLTKRGHLVSCFTPTIDKRLCFPDVIQDYDIKTFFPMVPKVIPHSESLDILLACIFFPFIARRFCKYDVILGANQPGPWFGWLIKKLCKTPYVIYLAQLTRVLYPRKIDKEVGVWVKEKSYVLSILVKLTKPLIYLIDRISIAGADKMLVNGNYIGQVLSRIYRRDHLVCPAGANLSGRLYQNRWNGQIKANNFVINKPYILLTNRHFPQKKFEYAINALEELLRKALPVSLVITGNPTFYTKMLKETVIKNKLKGKVIFTGFVSEKELQNLYAGAAVYVYTAPEEDFGMGILESMAYGVPVVAWDKGGPSKTIINGKTGFLIKPYLQQEFTGKIKYLLLNKKQNIEMGKNAYERVKQSFTYKNHIDILENTLLCIANKNENF